MDIKFRLLQHEVTRCPETWGMRNECAIFYRIYYILGGEAWYSDEKHEKERFKKNHLYILPVMHPYTLWHNVKNPLYVVWFHVEMNLETAADLIEIPIRENSGLYHLLKALEIINHKPEYFAESEQIFGSVLNLLNKKYSLLKICSKRMQEICSYIEENLGKDMSVQKVADYAGMERSYFSKLFKKTFRMSPRQYIYAKKMNCAAELIIQGKRIKEVCRRVGYTDEKAFSRAFKQYMEMSPGEYGKRHIEQP